MGEILGRQEDASEQDRSALSDVSGVHELPHDVTTIDGILSAKRRVDKDLLKKLIERYLNSMDENRPANEIRYVGEIAFKELSDPSLVVSTMEVLEEKFAWKEISDFYLILQEPEKAAEALSKSIDMLIRKGNYETAYAEAILTRLSIEKRKFFLKKIYGAALESNDYDSVLSAAFHAQRDKKFGFTKEDVKRAAMKAYTMALEKPHKVQQINQPGTIFEGYQEDDGKSDAELIKEQFGLTEK